MKKITVLMLVLFLLINGFTAFSADPVEKDVSSAPLEFMSALQIIDPDVDPPQSTVSRAVFSLYVARLLNIDENETSDVRYFSDMPMNHFAASAVNTLLEQGIITKGGDRFRPSDPITLSEAYKMILSAMGYDGYAELKGGFPGGYMQTARDLKIDISVENINEITTDEAARLLYEAVQKPVYGYLDFDAGNVNLGKTDKTLLSKYKDIYFCEGPVTGIYGGALNLADKAKENEIYVDGVLYECGEEVNTENYLGSYVKIFYRQPEKTDTGEIIFIDESEALTEPLIIDIDNFVEYSVNGSVLVYYPDIDSDRTKRVVLDAPLIIYNGFEATSNLNSLFSGMNKGTVTLKDSNNDKEYDVMLIEDFKNMVVNYISKDMEKIYNKLGTSWIDLSEYDSVKIFEGENKAEVSDIQSGCVVGAAASADGSSAIKLVISTTQFNGVADRIDPEEKTIYVNGTEYRFDKSYWEEFSNTYGISNCILIGQDSCFMLDHLGKIAFAQPGLASSMQYGVLLDCKRRDEPDPEDAVLKILTADSGIQKINCAKKVRIDGVKIEENYDLIMNALDVGENITKKQLIRYRTDSDGNISRIDTPKMNLSYESSENSLTPVFENEKGSHWYNSNRLGIKALMNAQTIVFYMPNGADNPDEQDCYVGKFSDIMINDVSYISDAYNISSLNAYTDAVVCYYNYNNLRINSNSYRPLIMVDSINYGLNDDDEPVTFLNCFSSGTKTTYEVSSEIDFSGVDKGDLILLNFDINGNVAERARTGLNDITMVYDYSEGTPNWTNNASNPNLYNSGTTDNYRNEFQLSY